MPPRGAPACRAPRVTGTGPNPPGGRVTDPASATPATGMSSRARTARRPHAPGGHRFARGTDTGKRTAGARPDHGHRERRTARTPRRARAVGRCVTTAGRCVRATGRCVTAVGRCLTAAGDRRPACLTRTRLRTAPAPREPTGLRPGPARPAPPPAVFPRVSPRPAHGPRAAPCAGTGRTGTRPPAPRRGRPLPPPGGQALSTRRPKSPSLSPRSRPDAPRAAPRPGLSAPRTPRTPRTQPMTPSASRTPRAPGGATARTPLTDPRRPHRGALTPTWST